MSYETESHISTTRPSAEVEAGAWSRKALFLVMVVAFSVRVVWLLNVNTMPVTDFYWYYERALVMAGGGGYSLDGEPTAYWPVGYPAFLAMFFKFISPTITFAKLLNLLLVMGSIGISFRLAHRLFRSNAVAVVSSLLLCFHLNWIAYSGILASEPLYAFLTLWGTWVLLTGGNDKGKWTMGGFLFALATLVRPQAALIPLVVLWCASGRDADPSDQMRFRRALTSCYVMIVLVVSLWSIRNFVVFRAPVVVSTNMGDNLLIGNHEGATGGYTNPNDAGVDLSGLGEIEREKTSRKAALDYMTSHPWRTVKLWPAKLWETFGQGSDGRFASDGPYWSFQKVAGQLTVPGAGVDKAQFLAVRKYANWYHGALMLLFVVSVPALIFLRRRVEPEVNFPALGVAMVAYAAFVSVLFFGNSRFAFAVIPFITMYAGALLVVVWQSLLPQKEASPDHWGSGL